MLSCTLRYVLKNRNDIKQNWLVGKQTTQSKYEKYEEVKKILLEWFQQVYV